MKRTVTKSPQAASAQNVSRPVGGSLSLRLLGTLGLALLLFAMWGCPSASVACDIDGDCPPEAVCDIETFFCIPAPPVVDAGPEDCAHFDDEAERCSVAEDCTDFNDLVCDGVVICDCGRCRTLPACFADHDHPVCREETKADGGHCYLQ